MKNIIKYILIFVIAAVGFSSCEDLESNFDALTKDYDKGNATYYVQFLNASASYETAIDEAGLPTNIETTVGVALLGSPQSSDIQVELSVDPASTLESNMYTLSASSITIPAGETSGSVTLTAVADEMPEDEVLNLVVNMAEGVPAAPSANVLNYSMKRIKFCPLLDLNDLVGSWTGADNWGYATKVVTSLDGENFMIQGLNEDWMQDAWGEEIQEMVPVVVTMNPNGTLVIDRQYYMTTLWDGAPYRYEVSATGKWDNCVKTLSIEYEIFYEGDDLSLCGLYGYCFSEDISLVQ
jgi:hypothetical protein